MPDPDPESSASRSSVADGLRGQPLRRRSAARQADPDELRPAGPALGRQLSEVYPQIKPGQKANDKILILEDTDGDGKADKTTVFADGLLIPTGIEPGDGGAYVANSTELLHLKTPTATARPTRRRVVLSGFGTEDTHHILHTLPLGPDGMLYFNQSIYIHSHIETPHGVRRLNGGGIWQFRPETMRARRLRPRAGSTPGATTSTAGASRSSTDGAGGEGINYVSRARYYVAGARRRAHPARASTPAARSTAAWRSSAAGTCPTTGRATCITNDFRGHRVCRFARQRRRQRASPRASMPELIKSDAPRVPADRREDGAGRRDLHRRLVQPDHPARRGRFPRPAPRPHPRPHLARDRQGPAAGGEARSSSTRPSHELLEHLKDPEDWTRQQAKRVLKERGAEEVLPELATVGRDELDPKDSDARDVTALKRLWVFGALRESSIRAAAGDAPLRALVRRLIVRARNEQARLSELATRAMVAGSSGTVTLEPTIRTASCPRPGSTRSREFGSRRFALAQATSGT